MQQSYHSNTITKIHIRNQIYGSNLKNSEIAQKFKISEATVGKWKSRKNKADKNNKPDKIYYLLTYLQKIILVKLRKITWWALDEITETFFPENPNSKRSAVYRLFVKEGIRRGKRKGEKV